MLWDDLKTLLRAGSSLRGHGPRSGLVMTDW